MRARTSVGYGLYTDAKEVTLPQVTPTVDTIRSMSSGDIVGIVVVVFVILILIAIFVILIIVIWYRRRTKKSQL